MTERLTKEREQFLRNRYVAAPDLHIQEVWAELDAVRKERDEFERKFDYEFKSVTEVLNQKRLLTLQLATVRKIGDDLYESLHNAPTFDHEPDCSAVDVVNLSSVCDCGAESANDERKERLETWSNLQSAE